MPESTKLLRAQRDEYKAEADRLRGAGNYLAAAMRFCVPRLCTDPFYADAHAAVKAWELATEEVNGA